MLLALFIPAAQPQSRLLSAINNDQTIVVSDNTPRVISSGAAIDQGAVPRSQIVPRLFLHFTMTAAQRADLAQFLQAVQDRRSPQYHQFLTPEQYADRFGLGSADIEKISRWLENSGFHSLQVARSRSWISFSGTAAQAESTFHTAIHRYSIHGEEHWSNATDPRVPKAMQGLVDSIRGLHNIPLRPNLIHLHPNFTSSLSGSHFLAPYDWATIYDVQPLYTAGLDGTGVSIAILGQSDVNLANIQTFRSLAGLSANVPTVIVPPGDADPGYQSASGDETESNLDLEWAGGIAKNATILFVTASAITGNGVEDSMTYAVDNNIAPIVSVSYGLCEPQETLSDFNAQTSLFEQANAQGMTIIASSGDSGATACDQGVTEMAATLGLAVNFPASSPYVTGIGGTTFNDSGGYYWNSSNNASGGSAVSYIPEVVWNDAFQYASGGGASILVTTKPTWQTGTGVPNDGVRDVPDLAFSASPDHDGYLICETGYCTNGFRNSSNSLDVIGGTSAGAPSFAGLLALVIQQKGAGTRLGNINQNLYSLAQISPDAFHDITSGNNEQACATGTPNCPSGTSQIGYVAGTGYDQTTGLGSLDGYNFAQQWYGDFQISASPTTVTLQPGSSTTAVVSLTAIDNFSGNVSFTCSVSSNLVGVTCAVPATTLNSSGTTSVTITASSSARSTPRLKPPSFPPVSRWLPWILLFVLVPAISARKPAAFYARPAFTVSSVLLVAIAFGVVSCGGGGSSVTSTVGTSSGGTTATPQPLTLSCSLPNAVVGFAYSGACAASGGTAPFTYSITTDTDLTTIEGFSINSSTGAITGTPKYAGTFSFVVHVTDSGSPAQTALVPEDSFIVSPPTLTLSCALPAAVTGAAYQNGCTVSGGLSPLTYSISAGALPAGLSLNTSDGKLFGTATTPGTSSFTLTVTDSSSPAQSVSQAVSFVVYPGPLVMNCFLNVSGVIAGIGYNESCGATGGTPPYLYSVSSGSLPPGLSLNPATGSVTGIPTVAGTYNFTMKVVDSGSPALTTTQAIAGLIIAPSRPFALSCLPPTGGVVGSAYSASVCLAGGGTQPYAYSVTSGSLPPGLALNSLTGNVAGTPTTAGTYAFTLQATDSSTPPASATQQVTNLVIIPHGSETGTVTITATSGGITNTTTITVNVP